jgi:hypothetical protein
MGYFFNAAMTTDELQRLYAVLAAKFPDIQVQNDPDQILFISTKFFLEVKDGFVSMSVLTNPITKFRYTNMDDMIEFALKHV